MSSIIMNTRTGRPSSRRRATMATVVAVLATLTLQTTASGWQASGPASRPDKKTQEAQKSGRDAGQQGKDARSVKGGALLAGPKIEDTSEQGPPASMTRNRRVQQVPVQQWLRLLREIDDLTPAQLTSIQQEASRFQAQQRAFNRSDGKELRELRTQIRKIRQTDQRVDPKLLRKAEHLQQMAPKPQDLQQQIWGQLGQGQQEKFRLALDAWRDEQAAKRADQADQAMTDAAEQDRARTDQTMTDDAMTQSKAGSDKSARQGPDRRRDARTNDANNGRDLSDLDRNARRRLRFLRQLQKRTIADN